MIMSCVFKLSVVLYLVKKEKENELERKNNPNTVRSRIQETAVLDLSFRRKANIFSIVWSASVSYNLFFIYARLCCTRSSKT